MQIYVNGQHVENFDTLKESDVAVVLGRYEESEECLLALGFDILSDSVSDWHESTHYENHRLYDFFCVKKPDLSLTGDDYCNASAFFNEKRLVLFTDNKELINAVQGMMMNKPEHFKPIFVIYEFFSALLAGNSGALEDIEDVLTQMEGGLVTGKDEDFIPNLLQVRKKLLVLKRYYEALFDLLQDMGENSNGYLTGQQLARLRIYTNKSDRLFNAVNSLREYATQVREAYQSQIDIGQNEIMKFFTVITAIFLPLTLMVGWYGMNLKMPEFEYEFTYPMVIVFSVCIVVLMLRYFKKKRWF